MPQVRMRETTFSVDHGGRLHAGQLVEVDDDVERRWLRNGLAADKDDKEAKAALGSSADALQAEVDRLNAQIARLQGGQSPEGGPSLPESPYGDQADGLADLGLTEQQRANLERAGFATRRQLADATDDELLEVGGIGAATVTRLRDAVAAEPGPFGTDAASSAITQGPGPR